MIMTYRQPNYSNKIYCCQGFVSLQYCSKYLFLTNGKKESQYDQVIPQSHTADQPMAPLGRATEH